MSAHQAFAGQSPYISAVGDDALTNPFYNSPKLSQPGFVHGSTDFQAPEFPVFPAGTDESGNPVFQGETVTATKPVNQPEVCDIGQDESGHFNARVGAGFSGRWTWDIVLPMSPSTNPVIHIQCGVLKPDSLAFHGAEQAMVHCAAETGERSFGLCNRRRSLDKPGTTALKPGALPTLRALAFKGPFNLEDAGGSDSFHLTAFRNPGQYASTNTPAGDLRNSNSLVVLDGGKNTRVSLNACMPKTLIVRFPVTGQINALGETEFTLNEGDGIRISLDQPASGVVDLFCHAESVKLMGQGEPETLIEDTY